MLNPGDRFGDYAVVKLLGKGGMGAVYLLKTAEGAQVAAKILDPATAGDHESRKRFVREAELALGVKHPNLVETYDVGEDPDTGLCYILMEYVPGGSLADRLKGGSLPINDAIRIVYQIATVLELARQKGIVHRDIKPDNIMFGADGKAKLADLGIARGGSLGTDMTTVTQTGMMIGTPAYMAPEQMLDAHHVDTRADIYSLGIVFYEMLAGQRPNPTDTVVQLMAKAVAGEPIPDVRKMRPEVSAAVAELVSLMCAMKADERVATPREVTTALSQIAHGREVTVRRKAPKAVKKRSVANGWKLAVGFGGFLVVAAVVAFGLLCSNGVRTKPLAPQPVQVTVVTNTVVKTEEKASPVRRPELDMVKELKAHGPASSSRMSAPIAADSVRLRRGKMQVVASEEKPVPRITDPNPRSATVDGFTWHFTLKDGSAILGRGAGRGADREQAAVEPDPEGELSVPETLGGFPVREVGSYAFSRCERLREVVLPPSVRVITHLAFSRCPRLRFVDLALADTFHGLTFWLCRALEGVSVSPQNASFVAKDGVLYSRDMRRLVLYPRTRDRLTVPDTVREIGDWACVNGSFAEIDLPTQVVKVCDLAFGWCDKLKTFRQASGLEELRANAFTWCGALQSVSFPASLKRISGPQFTDCRSLYAVRFSGDAPTVVTQPSYNGRIFAGSPPSVEVLVDPKSRGWNGPGSSTLPDRWPVGDEDSRPISSESKVLDPAQFADEDPSLRVQKAVDALFPGWKVSGIRPKSDNAAEWDSAFVPVWRGRKNIVSTMPPNGETAVVLNQTVQLPKRHPVLILELASFAKDTDFQLKVKAGGGLAFGPRLICTPDERPYERIVVPLERWRGRRTKLEVVHECNGWHLEHAFWSKLEIVEGSGKEAAGPVGVVRAEVFPAATPKSTRWKKRGVWKYVTEGPSGDWKGLAFDDRKWKRTIKALGCDKGPLPMSVADLWRSDRIWIRRKFNWNGPTDVYKVDFDLFFDQDVEIYLNGQEVLRRGGWNFDWVPTAGDAKAFAAALRQGENVLAVTVNGDGPSYFDCGLAIEMLSDYNKSTAAARSAIDPKKLYHDDTTKAVQKTLNVLFPGWKTSANKTRNKGTSSVVGYVADYRGRRELVCTLPPSEDEPVSIFRRMRLPSGHPALRLSVCKNMTYQADFDLQVFVDGQKIHEECVNDGKWHEPVLDLSRWAGKDVKVELRQCALKDNAWGRAYWSKIAVE